MAFSQKMLTFATYQAIKKRKMKSMYPLEILNFPEIISGNYLYVDKTAWVYQLAHYAKYQFLSRPRRF